MKQKLENEQIMLDVNLMHLTSECIMFQICTYLSADSHSIIEMHVVHCVCVCVCVCAPLTTYTSKQLKSQIECRPHPTLPFPSLIHTHHNTTKSSEKPLT